MSTHPDPVVDQLATHAMNAHRAPEPEAVAAARDRLLDTVAIGIASHRDRAVAPALQLVHDAGTGPVPVWGTSLRTSVSAGALANGVATRTRDQNDAYFGQEALHPSDMLAVLMAAATAWNRSGGDLIEAILVAYDVSVTLADEWTCWRRGADHVNLLTFGTVAGLARLRGLEQDRTAAAISIAATAMIATRQSRVGDLTDWKSYAAANQCVNAAQAVALAAGGADGPTQALTGAEGFANLALAEPVGERIVGLGKGRARLLDTHTKVYPVGYLGQGPTQLALELHDRLSTRGYGPERIREAELQTFQRAIGIMGDERKWFPTTRATADHSLPYTTAVGLLDGRIDHESYAAQRFRRADIERLLPRIRVVEEPRMTARYPAKMPARLEVLLDDGTVLVAELDVPTGHASRPLSPAAQRARSTDLLATQLPDQQVVRLVDLLISLPAAGSMVELAEDLIANWTA